MLVPLASRIISPQPIPMTYSSMFQPSGATLDARSLPSFNSPPKAPKSITPRKRAARVVRSPRKPKATTSTKVAKKQAVPRKRTTQPSTRSRLIGPTTRANPQSERSPADGSSAMDVDTPDSAASPSLDHDVRCWIGGCTAMFASADELQGHHNVRHWGYVGTFRCPFEGCSTKARKLGDIKRHMNTMKHGGAREIRCEMGCDKVFSRRDALKRHQESSHMVCHPAARGTQEVEQEQEQEQEQEREREQEQEQNDDDDDDSSEEEDSDSD
ncbi:hypothetical protein GYMLUDRAFT_965258 [Collybiopsis luxurians FD-317 M1]|uniref:C2H2-type domain-containing protein n=1 Tax=Collybiopsis luxurians FD-317 M1 TaxID=944289 RepID=A0A0D0BDQ4_9AGAR|nr:hypothetical protein GYMLUDRAFT_965258 [Collybiopsis luxurians FD-317 M1]